MKKIIGIIGLASAALLAGCGGGGGSPGETFEQYQITLTADRTTLPLNIAHQPAGIGAYAPYTTTLNVHATAGGRPIPNAEDGAFACNVESGLGVGALYYLDGDDEHEDDDGNPVAYRSITLGANAGGNSFHFHAGDQAGEARITCAVTDPRDNRIYSASANITVGAATGRPASVIFAAQAPFYLGSQNNLNDIRNNIGLQAFVMDDANQPIGPSDKPNVRVRILPTTVASQGARLIKGSQSGNTIEAHTESGGVALFSLSSGPNRGVILLELSVDRQDNDVSNGIQDQVTQLLAVQVVDGVSLIPLSFAGADMTVQRNTPFAEVLEATGGTPPFVWENLTALPAGLTLSGSGVVSGIASARAGTYVTSVRVTDVFGNFDEGSLSITVTDSPIAIASASIQATDGQPFSYVLTATGGVEPYTWSILGGSSGVSVNSATGVISGSLSEGSYSIAVQVTDSNGNRGVTNVSIEVKEAP